MVALAVPAECARCCAANNLSLLKLKKLTIGCCMIIGVGSTYAVYKYLSLKKSIKDLEKKIENLSSQLNYLEDSMDDIEAEICNKDDEAQCGHRSRSKERSDAALSKCDGKSNNSHKRSVSNDSEALCFRTPSTSPEGRSISLIKHKSKSVSFNAIQSQFSENTLKTDDNKSLEHILHQSREEKLQLLKESTEKYEQDPSNLDNCLNLIRVQYISAETEYDLETKKELNFQAYELAKRCLSIKPNLYITQKWYAMTTGRIIDYLGINEKVKSGFEFKEHLDKAINYNPFDYLLYYLRGRWAFRMCNLSWAEKGGIRLIYGKIPRISIETALDDFVAAEKIHPRKSKGNLLYLAKCLIAKGKVSEAREYLEIASSLPSKTSEHEKDSIEIDLLLKKYFGDKT